jgi:hypothetical protein
MQGRASALHAPLDPTLARQVCQARRGTGVQLCCESHTNLRERFTLALVCAPASLRQAPWPVLHARLGPTPPRQVCALHGSIWRALHAFMLMLDAAYERLESDYSHRLRLRRDDRIEVAA